MYKRILCGFLVIVVLAFAIISCQAAPQTREGFIVSFSDGEYDKDYFLVELAGSNPEDLADNQRSVLVEAFTEDENGEQQKISSVVALGFIYGDFVAVSLQLFYVGDAYSGYVPGWQFGEVSFRTYLLPDTRVDDSWQKEELGQIFIEEGLELAVIKRANPIINIKTDYVIGQYEDIAVGSALYATGQKNGRITVDPSSVNEVYTDEDRHLFGTSRSPAFSELGSLAFAARDGKLELVGFLCTAEAAKDGSRVYVYYRDIQQIIDFIKTK